MGKMKNTGCRVLNSFVSVLTLISVLIWKCKFDSSDINISKAQSNYEHRILTAVYEILTHAHLTYTQKGH